MNESPVFLVGSERSGTTLLRLMLDHHPQIAFHFEFEFAVEHVPDGEGWPALEAYYDRLETDRIFQRSGLTIDRSLSYPYLVRSFLEQRRRRDGKPIVGATVHRAFDRLPRLWPQARFIHLLRDGRDVARSVVAMGWAGHLWHAAQWWLEAEQTWQRLLPTLNDDQWIEVRYERLLAEPVAVLTDLCRFIGVDYEPAMLEYDRDSTYDRPNPALAYQWKRKLTDRQVQWIEAQIGPMLVERGYELSGRPVPRVGALRRWWFMLRSRLGRARFRARRYGLNLVCQDFIARRIGARPWQKRIQLAINAIDVQHLK